MTDKFLDPKTGKEMFRITDDNKQIKILKEKTEKDLSDISDEELLREFAKRFESNKEE